MFVISVALILGAYLLGSIPWGLVATRMAGSTDIRENGSGNIGATNVNRVAGPAPALLTLAGDVGKGALPVIVAFHALGSPTNPVPNVLALIALAAFFGHLYPIYLRFRTGGKGVATTAGSYAALSPAACLICLMVFAVMVFWTRRVSIGSLSSSAALPIAVWLTTHSLPLTLAAGLATLFIFIRHAGNIRRLLAGTEPKLVVRPRQ
jgi:glycerol-3-phosphate acyltransferase PlsY